MVSSPAKALPTTAPIGACPAPSPFEWLWMVGKFSLRDKKVLIDLASFGKTAE